MTVRPPRSLLLPLLRDLSELKRVRPALPSTQVGAPAPSLAARSFLRSWAALAGGVEPVEVAVTELDAALVATRLAGADVALLVQGGLDVDAAHSVWVAAREAALDRCGPWAELLAPLAPGPPHPREQRCERLPPAFASLLSQQPRAPATRAGLPRLTVEPAESHAEHCAVVALLGVVMAAAEGADAGTAFLAGLSHHLHNAWLPDGGFAGEQALGDHLATITDRFRRAALEQLPAGLARGVDVALAETTDASTAEGRAFHAADVIDRVLQMHHHAHAAAFTVEQAIDEYGLIHDGPLQDYHHQVLDEVGL